MHEMSIVQFLLEQVRSFIPDGATLKAVRIEVGRLEHLDPDVMQTAWSVMTESSGLNGAELTIVPVALRVRCGACGNEFEPEEPAFMVCPSCERVQPVVLAGTGVLLRSLEVDEPVHGPGRET